MHVYAVSQYAVHFVTATLICYRFLHKILTLFEAISETLLCVCIVSSWSRHQSSSSRVSIAVRIELFEESSKVKQKATVGAFVSTQFLLEKIQKVQT